VNCPSCAAVIQEQNQWKSRGNGDAWSKEVLCTNCKKLFRLDAITLKEMGNATGA